MNWGLVFLRLICTGVASFITLAFSHQRKPLSFPIRKLWGENDKNFYVKTCILGSFVGRAINFWLVEGRNLYHSLVLATGEKKPYFGFCIREPSVNPSLSALDHFKSYGVGSMGSQALPYRHSNLRKLAVQLFKTSVVSKYQPSRHPNKKDTANRSNLSLGCSQPETIQRSKQVGTKFVALFVSSSPHKLILIAKYLSNTNFVTSSSSRKFLNFF